MPLAPFLHFRGTCAEALAFYGGVFEDPSPKLMRYSEARRRVRRGWAGSG